MGMAAYGRPRFVDRVRQLIALAPDGSFHLNMRRLAYHRATHTFDRAFVDLFGPPRREDAEVDETYADIAASIQLVVEEAMLGVARRARTLTESENLCMAGGVALNVLANARILREAGFRNLWIQPAAGDSGGCIGAASFVYHSVLRYPDRHHLDQAYLGPAFSNAQIHTFLDSAGVSYSQLSEEAIAPTVARLLARNHVVGWFQGHMEFGPRALGARSILANPTEPTMKETLNAKIKHREPFRPFAPSTMLEAAPTYFDFGTGDFESPFMLFVARVRPEKADRLPAVTHVDGTARVQTVRYDQNPLYYDLIREFGSLTGVPVLVNTSFNVRGEPIVCTPEQAFNSIAHTYMDYLILGDALVPESSKRQLAPYPGAQRLRAGDEVIV
jgi:carbamoyltransferase